MNQEFDGNVDLPVERTLTVINHGEEKGKTVKTRVTIARDMVQFLIASEDTYEVVDGIELRKVNVILNTGNNLELCLTLLDLNMLERAIGMYFISPY
ncbi:MAG TPA: hypothetical protein VN855_00490 [Candidatus Acidoferrum sp.]|nr:hypothetical protein [Candidatus Acidoferrum sp.]